MFLPLKYFVSNSTLVSFESGMMKRFRPKENTAISAAENMYGTIILWKLIPQERMATISESAAILDVKNITVMNTNRGLNMFMKYGMKFT